MNKIIMSVLLLVLTLGMAQSLQAQPVRMGYLQNDLHHLPLWVAQDKGLFAANGVEVEIAGVFRAGPEIMTAMAAGSLDMAYVGEAPATIAFARGGTARVVAQANTEGSALMVSSKSTAVTVADLKGKTIAVPGNGAVQDFLIRRALKQAGVSAADTHIITLAPPEMDKALAAGQIDAFIAWQPYPARAMATGTAKVLASSAQLWKGHPCCALVATEAVSTSREAAKVVQAHVQAIEYIRTHPEEAVAVAVQRTGMEEAVVRAALADVRYTAQPDVHGEEEYVRFLNEFGYIHTEAAADFTNKFIKADLLPATNRDGVQ
ncbi:MAG: aliphatic sulfonate ABC transporter substrate-binding protein [Desulfovibrionaceae bacterium]|nr:aliphatic sulfonate ABC transporter substrate-binding protein [Desulfovibrionaceae bacterium]